MIERKEFEILCVTMHQKDFSKIEQMNIHSNVVFANQTDEFSYQETLYDGIHTARMISTQTRGVGINRNIAMTYANAQYCLLADDDVCYRDNMEQIVLSEFCAHPDADVMIFHLISDTGYRPQKQYRSTRKVVKWEQMPWATFRVAFRSDSVRKANLWFSTLFGGGCIFPSGEDSMWLTDARRAGLRLYVSDKTIGTVSFAESTWFTGFDEKMFYGKGAFYAAVHPKTFFLWAAYFSFRTEKLTDLSIKQRFHWIFAGRRGYGDMKSFQEYCGDKNHAE